MSLSLYEASIPGYLSMLKVLDGLLVKAEAHAKETGTDLQSLADSCLAPDMKSLIGQVQFATDAAKSGAARLAGVAPPSFPDTETTWAELRERVAKALAFVGSIKPEDVSDDPERIVEVQVPGMLLKFTARNFLLQFSIPNFLFHVTTTYAILRLKGVPVGKMDYLSVTLEG